MPIVVTRTGTLPSYDETLIADALEIAAERWEALAKDKAMECAARAHVTPLLTSRVERAKKLAETIRACHGKG